jgi:hypothetical protein
MDRKTFDAVTRGFGAQRSRRAALKSLAAGLFGLGAARTAAAPVGIERATCGQVCRDNVDCNAGLRCSRNGGDGICVAILDSRDSCNQNIDCDRDFERCSNGRCVNVLDCSSCRVNADCPSGEACRDGNCDGGNGNRCNGNRDCRNNERCRNGRCVRRN